MAATPRVRDKELWPHIVDRLAKEQPEATYGLWPVTTDSYDAGFRAITYGQLANVVNGLAWWIVNQLGRGNAQEGDVLTYIGLNDVRLTGMILASVKAGYTLFPTSPRNSPAAQKSLFNTLKCKTLVTTDPSLPPVQPILDAVKPRCLTVPSIQELLCDQPHFPYDKTFEAGRWDPLVIWHSSGSTGLPKPLMFAQDAAVRHHACASQDIPADQHVTSVEHLISGKRIMVTVPSFHGAGILMYMLWAIAAGCIPIAPAAVGIVTAHGLVEALTHTPADVAVLVPSVVADLAQNPEQLAICAKHLSLILYIGGDLPQAIGDIVARKIPLRCWWGASEVGIPHQLIPSGLGPADWRYVRFHPSVGAVFDPAADGTYELVVRQDKSLSATQSTFSIRGQENLQEYRTKDLFQPHPNIPNSWSWRSRADDIIVFLNGEKTNPIGMEQHVVAQHSDLAGALVVGTQRFQAALLVEPAHLKTPLRTSEQAALIERIWPTVQEANAVVPAHARVEKALILVVDRPMIRSGKGTIQRAASVQQYSTAIETLYLNADVTVDVEDGKDEEESSAWSWGSTDAAAVARLIRDSACAVVGKSIPDDNSSFFDYGMDSLMALQILRRLRRGLHRPDLALSTIYSNPSVNQLSRAITTQKEDGGGTDSDALLLKPIYDTYRALVEQIPKPPAALGGVDRDRDRDTPVTAVLTGSTGTVGTYLLRMLLDHPGIKHVFCLNRSEDGGSATQRLRMTERGMDTSDLDKRVTFLQSDLSRPRLGLDDKTYEDLRARARAGLIIHNAWPVNFNLRLTAFRPQLAGLVNLFSLCTDVVKSAGDAGGLEAPHFVFVSSVSAVGRLGTEETGGGENNHPRAAAAAAAAPERVLSMSEAPQTNGYARSKFLSEMLCDVAARELRVPVTVARVGQVAGAAKQLSRGEWNRNEWLPSLVLGSVAMGCLPDDLGAQFSEVDWVPVDLLADVLVDLVVSSSHQADPDYDDEGGGGARVYNLRNPRTTTWTTLLPSVIDTVKARLGPESAPLEVVPPSVWLKRLEQAGSREEDGDDAAANPAIKLVDFYRDYLWKSDGKEGVAAKTPPMDIDKACARSSALRAVEAISPQSVQKWVEEWLK